MSEEGPVSTGLRIFNNIRHTELNLAKTEGYVPGKLHIQWKCIQQF
jgi:hypothetical protein